MILIGSAITSITVGVLAHPAILLGILGLGILAAAACDARFRLGLCSIGLLVLFGGTSQGAAKYLFLILIAVFLLDALVEASSARRLGLNEFSSGISLVLGLYLAATGIVVLRGVTTFDLWFRDVLPYLLIPVFVLLGTRFGSTVKRRHIEHVLLVSGFLAVSLFAIQWVSRRTGGEAAFNSGLTSFVFCGFFLVFCYSKFLQSSHHKFQWLVLWFVCLCALLATGTRSFLAFLIMLPVMHFAVRRRRRDKSPIGTGRFISVFALIVITVVAAVVALPSLESTTVGSLLVKRVGVTQSSIDNLGADQSFAARTEWYRLAWAEVRESPIYGTGPGRLYRTGTKAQDESFALDTPLMTAAKFGVAGSAFIAFYLVIFYRRLLHPLRSSDLFLRACLAGFGAVFLSTIPFGPFLEDKGFALTLMFLVALVVRHLCDEVMLESQPRAPASDQ